MLDDENFPRAAAARRAGLRAAFGFPVRSARGVLGVLEFYAGEPRRLDGELLATMSVLGDQIGQVIERRRDAEGAAGQGGAPPCDGRCRAGLRRADRPRGPQPKLRTRGDRATALEQLCTHAAGGRLRQPLGSIARDDLLAAIAAHPPCVHALERAVTDRLRLAPALTA